MVHFYLFQKENIMLISDLPKDKIKSKYGQLFEIVNSVRDKESLDLVKPRILRSYPRATVKEDFYSKKVFSEETREKLRKAKLGKARPDSVKQKISQKMSGHSNFEGKRHNEYSKRLTALSMRDNKNVKGKKWIYDPRADKEKRVDKIIEAPIGFRKGRDPDSIDNLVPFTS